MSADLRSAFPPQRKDLENASNQADDEHGSGVVQWPRPLRWFQLKNLQPLNRLFPTWDPLGLQNQVQDTGLISFDVKGSNPAAGESPCFNLLAVSRVL